MKKIIPFAIMALSVMSCSKEEEPMESATEQQAIEIAKVLDGKFIGTEQQLTGLKTYEITFRPYQYPKKEEFTIPGEYVDIDKKVIVFGECTEVEYFGNQPVDTEWRYSVNIAYDGAQPELWFYPISVYGKYETHDITIINNTSFRLDDITYKKQ